MGRKGTGISPQLLYNNQMVIFFVIVFIPTMYHFNITLLTFPTFFSHLPTFIFLTFSLHFVFVLMHITDTRTHKFVRVTCKRNKAQGRRAVKPVKACKENSCKRKDTPEKNRCQKIWSCYQMHIRLCVDPVIPSRQKTKKLIC